MFTPKGRVEAALKWQSVDKVPFTMYSSRIPQCSVERKMRNRGLCIVQRMLVVKSHHPNVKSKQVTSYENGKTLVRTFFETPVGTVSTLYEPAGFTKWVHEKMFKSPEDYKIIRFIIEDEVFEENYIAFREAEKEAGEDFIFRTNLGQEPLQVLISGNIMGMEQFCIEWMDNRDEILELYKIIVEKRRIVYKLIADSPAWIVNYGGNIVPALIGKETFEKYYVPNYNEAAEILHKKGKLIGSHFDDNIGLIAEAVAETALDYIEAFTPAPDTDMSLGDARRIWKDKVLWLNFPSSLHLKTDEEVLEATVSLLNELDSPRGIIMGITENIPQDRWQKSCTAIMDGLEKHALSYPNLYLS